MVADLLTIAKNWKTYTITSQTLFKFYFR